VEQTVDKNGRTKWQLTPKNRQITIYLVLFRGTGVDRKGGIRDGADSREGNKFSKLSSKNNTKNISLCRRIPLLYLINICQIS
jgi:hypothetical protein